jgi:hypothetical protein
LNIIGSISSYLLCPKVIATGAHFGDETVHPSIITRIDKGQGRCSDRDVGTCVITHKINVALLVSSDISRSDKERATYLLDPDQITSTREFGYKTIAKSYWCKGCGFDRRRVAEGTANDQVALRIDRCSRYHWALGCASKYFGPTNIVYGVARCGAKQKDKDQGHEGDTCPRY